MSKQILPDLAMIETEHLLSAHTFIGIVKIRVTLEDGSIALGQIAPEAAREIASHLAESAARAEYEQDAWQSLTAAGIDEQTKGMILQAVRGGEYHRHQKGEQP